MNGAKSDDWISIKLWSNTCSIFNVNKQNFRGHFSMDYINLIDNFVFDTNFLKKLERTDNV